MLPRLCLLLLFPLLLNGPWLLGAEARRLPPPLPSAQGRFGQALAFVDARTLAIGIPGLNRVDIHVADHPSADQWGRRTTLSDSGVQGLGRALDATADGLLAAGAPDSDDETGAVLVYRRTDGKWRMLARLQPADGTPGERFGAALAFQGSRLLVGAPGKPVAGHDGAGMVYLFRIDGDAITALGTWQDTFPESGAGFGTAIAADERWAVVGVPGKDAVLLQNRVIPANGVDAQRFAIARGDQPFCGVDAGAVYLYPVTASADAQPAATLTPADIDCSDRFGTSVAIDTPWLAAGAPNKSVGDPFLSGQVYLYHLSDERRWEGIDILGTENPAESRGFGSALALTGSRLIVGAPGQAAPRFRSGALLVYRLVGGHWQREETLIVDHAAPDAQWGASLAMSADHVAAGAPLRACGADQAGMVALIGTPSLEPTGAFDAASGRLALAGVQAPDGKIYTAGLQQSPDDPVLFTLGTAAVVQTPNAQLGRYEADGMLYLPWIEVTFKDGSRRLYSAWLQQRPTDTPLQFQLLNACP